MAATEPLMLRFSPARRLLVHLLQKGLIIHSLTNSLSRRIIWQLRSLVCHTYDVRGQKVAHTEFLQLDKSF
jgi:hypothetical protein